MPTVPPLQWRLVADQLKPKAPKLAALMDEAQHDVLAYMSFPREHRQKLHSTNPLERLNGEIGGDAPTSSASSPTKTQDMTDLYVRCLEYPDKRIDGGVFNAGYENRSVSDLAEVARQAWSAGTSKSSPSRPTICVPTT